jgi:hypothetical protein
MPYPESTAVWELDDETEEVIGDDSYTNWKDE